MENSVKVRTPAKINLTLDILGKRNDGYHFMKTIMQSVSIFDNITIETNTTNRITVFCNNEDIPCDRSNSAYKAAEEFFKFTGITNPGIEIIIDKNIPVQAGLAGGSADAAGVIIGLDSMFCTFLESSELCDIGEKIGADVPFCIVGGTALAEGIGELLTPLPNLDDCYIVVAKGTEGISTKYAFNKIDECDIYDHPDTDNMIVTIATGNLQEIASLCKNVFENVTHLDEIDKIKDIMNNNHALCSVMSGSGSSVFGIFDKKRFANSCEDDLEGVSDFVEICSPVIHGAQII